MDIKFKIYKDKMILIQDGKNVVAYPKTPFSSERLLIGTFDPAVLCLKEGIDKISVKSLFRSKPKLYLQACEMNEGGLSEVEERCLMEVAHAAGAGKVEVVEN